MQNNKKRALITGISGQVGSFLAEILLEKGYDVHGIVRRHSNNLLQNSNIGHILDRVALYHGDMTDPISLQNAIIRSNPHEIYALASQSHVHISYDNPIYTANVVAIGHLNLLEAMRMYAKGARLVHASTSEMFGNSIDDDGFQRESSRLVPANPYAAAKVFAHNIGRNYRQSYNLFISNCIAMNHESILANSPIMIKDSNDLIDILPIEDTFKAHEYEGLLEEYKSCKVWNGSEWTKIIKGTRYRDINKPVQAIQTRDSVCETTLDHAFFNEDNQEIENNNLKIGDKLYKVSYPNNNDFSSLVQDVDFCKFLGFLVGDGYVSDGGRIRLIGQDMQLIESYMKIITDKFGWDVYYGSNKSGFENTEPSFYIECRNDVNFGLFLRNNIYTLRSNEKRVPKFILNSSSECKKAFFDGYYDADGRKAGDEKYFYKGFTTSSATLALGLIFIMKSFSQQDAKCKLEYRTIKNEVFRYYYVYFTSDYRPGEIFGSRRIRNEIIKKYLTGNSTGEFFDIQTESMTFCTGPNLVKIHNSPRRGINFVTAKVVNEAVKISRGLSDKLSLGCLSARRDWSHAKDVALAQWMILQHDKPDDWMVSSGISHSIEELCDYVFSKLGMNYKDYVVVDPKFIRPEETRNLRGDSSKIRSILGWKPEYTFETLMDEMIDHYQKIVK